MIAQQKELYQQRGAVATGFLLFFFLLLSFALYKGFDSIFNYQDPALPLQIAPTPIPSEVLYTLYNFLGFFFVTSTLIMLIGLWYLKKWAALGLTITYGIYMFIYPFVEPPYIAESLWSIISFALFNSICGLALLWGVFLGHYWDKLK